MKVKRLVSLLLAAMLIVGMIPTNAFAALSYDDSKGETNRANITLLVSKNAPATVSDYATISSKITTAETLAAAKTTLEANATKANAAWDGKSTESVRVGDVVYIGFKLTPEDVDNTITGIAATGFWVEYDPEVLSPVRLKDIYVDPYDEVAEETTAIEASEFDDEKQSYFNQTYYNDLAKGKDGAASGSLFSKVGGKYTAVDGINELFAKYCASANLSPADKASIEVKDGKYTGCLLFGVSNKMAGYYPLATGSTWDVVVPMIVNNTEKSSTTIKVVEDSDGTISSVALSTKTFDNKTELTNNQVVILGNGGKLKSTDATLTIQQTTPGLETVAGATTVVAGDSTTIKVQANEYAKFLDAASTASNWTVTNTGSGSPSVTAVSVDGKVATLTVTGVTAGDLTVEAASGVLANTSGTSTGKAHTVTGITAVTAPTATFDHSSLKLTSTSTASSLKYTVDDGTNWNAMTGSAGNWTATLTDAQISALNIADGTSNSTSVKVGLGDDTSVNSAVTITRKKAPKEVWGINYPDIKTGLLDGTNGDMEYTTDGTTWTTAQGGDQVTLTPGTDITYRTKGDANELPSSTTKLEVAPRPTLTIADANDAAAKKNGQTKVTVTGTGAKYIVDQTSNTTTMTSAAAFPADGVVNATSNDWIHAYIPATDSSFASDVQHLKGSGNTTATVELPSSLQNGATTFTVNLYAGSWKSSLTSSDISVVDTDDSGTNLFSSANANNGTLTVTLSSAFQNQHKYKITVNTSAVDSNKLSAAADTTLTVSGEGVTVTVKDENGNTLGTNFQADGASKITITLDSTTMATNSIKSIKTNGSKGTATISGDNIEYEMTAAQGAANTDEVVVTLYKPATVDLTKATKAWDGKTTYDGTGVTYKNKAGTAINTTAANVTYTLAEEAKTSVGSVNVTWTAGSVTDASGEYEVAASNGAITVTQTTLSSVTFATPAATEGTVATVVAAIEATKATVTTASNATIESTLGAFVTSGDVETKVLNAVKVAEKAKAEKAKETEAAAAYAADENTTGDAYDANGDKTPAFTNWLSTAMTEEGGSTTWSAAITAAGNDAAGAVTTSSTVAASTAIDLSSLSFTTTISDTNVTKFVSAPSDTTGYAALTTVTVAAKPASGGSGSWTPSVELSTGDFGTADGVVEVDDEGKITKLPGITNQKLGTVFKGWATQPGNANTIVKEGREIDSDTTLYAIFEGYMSGDTENGKTVARPNDPVTRGELLTMLVRAAGLYDASIDYSTTFADAQNGWYATYVGCAETAGIIAGDAEGTARPKDKITREEAAIFIAKAFKVDVAIGGSTEYVTDFNKTSTWAQDYVAAIVNNGTSIGYPVGDSYEFQASNEITRGEVAAMINKYIGLTEDLKASLSSDETVESPFHDVQNKSSWLYANMVFATLNAGAENYVTDITYPTRAN